ncbi:hypothetical protein M0805_008621 [Coniferiporia weirii]|nr:hypothetical protein M0805_008621 [Coniferiporia weirii]
MFVLVLEFAAFASAFFYLKSWLPVLRRGRNPNGLPLPPGPKGLPLVGNAFDMPDVNEQWEKARIWGKQYGDLVFVRHLGKPLLFVNSYEAANELFEERGNNYSSRPQNTLIEMIGWDWMAALMPYNDEHRKLRQYIHQFFGPSAIADFRGLQTQAIHRLLLSLLQGPDRFYDLTRRAAADIIMMLAYGHKVSKDDDPYVELANKGMRSIGEAEQFSIINMLPWLRYLPKWFPGTGFHEVVERGYKISQEMLHKPHLMAKKKIDDGTATTSMTSKLIEANSTEDGKIVDEILIARATGVTFAGGADTTVSTLNTFILAMVLHPDVQRRGHEELDRVIGKDNLPTMEDRENLPYVNAICSELYRWQTALPLSLAHCATEDDEYNGYFIPAGTTMLPNIWAMHRNPIEYPEPEKFIPERWMPVDGKKAPLDSRKTAFGFGRRLCPGRPFGDNTVFIGVASLLAAFDIGKALDVHGAPITPAVEYLESFIRHPKPFKCKITPRSDKVVVAVQEAVESADWA